MVYNDNHTLIQHACQTPPESKSDSLYFVSAHFPPTGASGERFISRLYNGKVDHIVPEWPRTKGR